MGTLEGRVALVTGAQQGIGRAIALAVGREGASVVVQYLDDLDAANDVAALVRESGPDAIIVQGDVGLREDCEAALAAGQQLGGVDLLVNNAGIFPRRSFMEMTDNEWNHVQNVNVLGGFRCLQLMARDPFRLIATEPRSIFPQLPFSGIRLRALITLQAKEPSSDLLEQSPPNLPRMGYG